MMNEIYDIVIIGAGPAGSTFARLLAKRNSSLKILLIDAQDEQTQKPCGGLLAPDAQKALAHYNLVIPNEILSTPQIFSVRTIDIAQNLDCSYQRMYLNMNRFAFDQWLISLIPDSVSILRDRCVRIESSDEAYHLTLTQKKSVFAKIIVGADGANSIIRKTFFSDKKLKKYVAIQQWFTHLREHTPVYYCVFDQQTSESCSWLMNKDEYVIYGGAFSKEQSREKFEEQKQRFCEQQNYHFGELIKTEACLVTSPRKYSDFFSGNDSIFLIGEAAGFISASSFEGISYAFESGEALANAFAEGNSSADIMKKYRQNIRPIKRKLLGKIWKRNILANPFLRKMIMKSGLKSISIEKD